MGSGRRPDVDYSYEFRCYIMVMLFGLLGIFRKKGLLAAITTGLLYYGFIYSGPYALDTTPAAATPGTGVLHKILGVLVQTPFHDIQLFAVFLAGSCFYVYRGSIPFKRRYALAAAALLCCCLFSKRLAEPGLAIFGGYLVVWFALHVKPFSIAKFFNKTDLSYGVYLYAWPIQKILIAEIRHITPYEVMALAFILSLIAAFLSWTFIEKPFLSLKSRRLLSSGPAVAQPAS